MKRSAPFLFEHRHEPLLPWAKFRRRMTRALAACLALASITLAIGATGYHASEGWSWLESTLNAAMILTGMGPVDELHTTAGKLFAIAYALFSGLVFLTLAALFLAPVAHRVLHAFHLDDES